VNLKDYEMTAPAAPTQVEEKVIIEKIAHRQMMMFKNRMNVGAIQMWITTPSRGLLKRRAPHGGVAANISLT
jgi:hypothetical protein